MCSRFYLIFLGIFLFLVVIYFPQTTYAASLTFQNAKSQIGVDEEFPVDVLVTISAKDGTQYYLRGVFYKPGTSNYCGYTWNGSNWFNGPYSTNNGWTNFLPITTINSSWSGQLKAKIDPEDPGCSDSGTYAFKIERFTTSGSGNFDTQTEQTIAVVIPTPTPTPAPTNTPVPTARPTAAPTPKPANTPTKSLVLSPTSFSKKDNISSEDAVLGTMSAEEFALLTPTPSSTNFPTKVAAAHVNLWTITIVIMGFCLLASCGILIFLKTEKGKVLWKRFF